MEFRACAAITPTTVTTFFIARTFPTVPVSIPPVCGMLEIPEEGALLALVRTRALATIQNSKGACYRMAATSRLLIGGFLSASHISETVGRHGQPCDVVYSLNHLADCENQKS